MIRPKVLLAATVVGLSISTAANAWFFFFIPTGAIQKAMETDPDTIAVSTSDRAFGQCAGFHLNQTKKGMSAGGANRDVTNPAAIPQAPTQTAESKFHSDMADIALQRSSEKDKVKSLAEAYSVRWGRVASSDRQSNLQYGANLAKGCYSNDMPLRFSEYPAWQARQENRKRQQAEEESKRIQAAEEEKRLRAEEIAKTETKPDAAATNPPGVDYLAEARKSARILGCSTSDVKVTGAENNSILMAANCGIGQELLLTCDKFGTCLRR